MKAFTNSIIDFNGKCFRWSSKGKVINLTEKQNMVAMNGGRIYGVIMSGCAKTKFGGGDDVWDVG